MTRFTHKGKWWSTGAVTETSVNTLTNKTLDDYTNFIHADWIHLRVKATEELSEWDVLMFVWFNNGEQAIEVAKRDNINVPAIWVLHDDLENGEFWMAVSNWLFKWIDTSEFSVWSILYPNTSGWFTATNPWWYAQQLAYVVRSHHINGEIMINVWPVYDKKDWRHYIWKVFYTGNDVVITGGEVLECEYDDDTIYRFTTNADDANWYSVEDSFYSGFDWTTLTGLLATRWE